MGVRRLGRYQIRGEIGRGTMGVVYRGYDPVLERDIALKTIVLPDGLSPERRERFLERFFLEAKIAGKLIHPNIVVTHDAATDEATGTPFIAMELLSGQSLQARLGKGALPWREALALVEPLAGALDYAHQQGVVHRDMKPANVMLTAKGVPKITDFGIAKLPTAELTQTGVVMGTPYFMSPEQLQGKDVDGRSDVFSLGALLYNLLTGHPPFEGADLASISQQVLYKHPAPPSELAGDVPESVDRVLARAMTKDPAERYPSAVAFAEDLARLSRGESPALGLSLGERTVPTVPAPSTPTLSAAPSHGHAAGRLVVTFIIFSGLAAAAYVRREDVRRLTEPFRAYYEESARRGALSKRAAVRLGRARELFERGRLTEAAGAVEEALAISRDAGDGRGEAEALLLRGLLAAEEGHWSQARADLESAGDVFEIYGVPEGQARALGRRADLERDLGRFELARSLYDRAEDAADVRKGRAFLALMTGDLEAAERGFLTAGEYAYAGAVAVARGNAEQADAFFDKAPESLLWRAYAARALGREDDARKLFDEAAKQFPEREGLDGASGHADESLLQTLFRAEPPTPRNEERRRRLP